MRISTSQIYDAGALSIQRNQSDLFKLQNQISTGRRILTPADDPVAAAQALVVTQSQAVTEQHLSNQDTATSQLGMVDSQLSSLTDLLQSVRERAVQAGNTTLSNSDRESIAFELEARLDEMLGIANSDNGSGDYLFSGYQGATKPFAIDGTTSATAPALSSPFAYYGDDGERLLQVSSSRQMAVNVTGSDVFMNIKGGNGSFVAATGVDVGGVSGAINQGSGTIDSGSVLDQQQWQSAVNDAAAGKPLEIEFSVDAATGRTQYVINDSVSGASTPTDYVAGQAIPLVTSAGVDFGSQVVISGQPEAGDVFTITPSSNQSIFQTLQNLIGALRTPVGTTTYTTTQFSNDLGSQLGNIDQAINNISSVQAQVGSRMNELDSLSSASSDLAIQYSSTLSDLQDLDYAKALSDFAKQEISLEAAQKSFVQISGLSLFNYL